MRQLKVKWHVDLESNARNVPALTATYKGIALRMTHEGGLYVGWINGVRRVSAESKGELYRKYMDEPEFTG